MTGFVDVCAPACMRVLEKPVTASPRWSVSINQTAGGNEQRNQNWEHPLWSFNLPEAAREQAHFEEILAFWLVIGGPFKTFPWRNPLDFASRGLPRPNTPPAFTASDQALGTGDGLTTTFQLRKVYTYGGLTYTRTIHLPVLASLLLANNGVAVNPADYTVSRPGGIVTFTTAPLNTHALTWGGLFDVEARFSDDKAFQGVVRGRRVTGFSDVNLDEVRPC